jgi:hypothetical protein
MVGVTSKISKKERERDSKSYRENDNDFGTDTKKHRTNSNSDGHIIKRGGLIRNKVTIHEARRKP